MHGMFCTGNVLRMGCFVQEMFREGTVICRECFVWEIFCIVNVLCRSCYLECGTFYDGNVLKAHFIRENI